MSIIGLCSKRLTRSKTTVESLDYFTLTLSIFFVLVAFIVVVVVSKKRLTNEKGAKEILKVRCGGRFGWLSANYPVATLSLYDGFVVVGHLKKYRIDYDEITDIYEKRHGLSTGVHIVHTARSVPSSIIYGYSGKNNEEGL